MDHLYEYFASYISRKLLLDEVKLAIDNESLSVLVFLDLRRAFDIINHNIQLSKMVVAGVSALSSAEASFALGRGGSLEAGERVRESKRTFFFPLSTSRPPRSLCGGERGISVCNLLVWTLSKRPLKQFVVCNGSRSF